jgi:hypothetical protein
MYIIIGALFAIVFVSFGVGRVDSSARGAGVGFRALIFPGVAALWPLLAWRWLRGAPRERNAHRNAAQEGRR